VFFEKSYYLAPALGAGGEKPYWLLLRAMERAGKVGMARFVLRTKEYLAAVRPGSGILVLETLFYADEVRDPVELRLPQEVTPAARELDMAVRLIESLTVPWDPGRYRDTYRERVLELVRSKADEGGAIVQEEAAPEPAPVFDLMEALKASVEAARAERTENPEAKAPTHKRSPGSS
jgi:DNA end-binding protein Ku